MAHAQAEANVEPMAQALLARSACPACLKFMPGAREFVDSSVSELARKHKLRSRIAAIPRARTNKMLRIAFSFLVD